MAAKHRKPDASPEAIRQRRSTTNRLLTILKAILNHAHREGRCASDDAWRTVRGFREADAARLRYLSDDESRRLTNACPPDFRALVTAALLTGLSPYFLFPALVAGILLLVQTRLSGAWTGLVGEVTGTAGTTGLVSVGVAGLVSVGVVITGVTAAGAWTGVVAAGVATDAVGVALLAGASEAPLEL